MPVVALLNTARPADAITGCYPSPCFRRLREAEVRPRMRRLGVLEYATATPYVSERRREAPAIVSFDPSHASARTARPVTPPPLTRRMCDDGIATFVLARVARLIPRVDSLESEVASTGCNEECGDHAVTVVTRVAARKWLQ